jgi:DNA-binding transcriptional ArsR family regulator/Zn-finger nucleic acid-binding protein
MVDANSVESPSERVATTVGERTIVAFELLGNETRLAILLVLWEAIDPVPPRFEPTLSFSELRRRVGMRHGEQFNYHLDRLVGQLVRKTDEGYTLTTSAKRILSTIFAGTLTAAPSFADEQIDAPCMLCGASTVVDYGDGVLTQRCPSCDGVSRAPGEPSGVIAREYRPPVGLENRTPQEFVRQGKTWHRHQRHAFIERTCPDCSGTVTTTVHVCDDHDDHDGTVCDHCDGVHEIDVSFVCDVCKASLRTGVWNTILTDVAVIAFFHEHGRDTKALEDELAYGVLYEAVERVAIHSEEPVEIVVTVELDGDRLDVVLDDEVHVLDVTERARDAA